MGVFSEIKPKNSARKNPFDRSAYSSYNTKCGLILPLRFWPTMPSSEYSLDLKALLRTQPLSTAAFAGFSINYDVVWTPYNDHYSSFNQFIAQRLNKQHTTQPDIQQIPHFQIRKFIELVVTIAVYDYINCTLSPDERRRYHDDQEYQITMPSQNVSLYAEHLPTESIALGCIRTLDLLRYGNYLPLVKSVASAIDSYLSDSRLYTDSDDLDLPLPIRLQAYLALDMVDNKIPAITGQDLLYTFEAMTTDMYSLIFSTIASLTPFTNMLPPDNYMVDLWPIMCYNKAFWQFYRNEYYDIDYVYYTDGYSTTKKTAEYVTLFNCDDINAAIIPDNYGNLSDNTYRLLCMFAVKPHQYKKDLFTGLLPSTQYGSVSTAFTDSDFHKIIGNAVNGNADISLNQVYSQRSDKIVYDNSTAGVKNTSSSMFKFDPAFAISVLELRKADALQRFRERMLRAGNKTKDIFVAHGWDEPYSEKAFDVQFLGTFDGRLDINVVASTAETSTNGVNTNLGQLAANGLGAIGGSTVHFKCHDFGCLMVVAYITKDAIYDAYGVDKSHMLLEPTDFPYPELQNVSLAPVTEDQLNIYHHNGAYNNNVNVLGFLPQNMCYKTDTDLVHGEFFAVNPFDYDLVGQQNTRMFSAGIFANMNTPRLDIFQGKTLQFFYIQPDCADNIFVVNADGTQETDQFFGNVRFDLKCVQPLDVIGLPI